MALPGKPDDLPSFPLHPVSPPKSPEGSKPLETALALLDQIKERSDLITVFRKVAAMLIEKTLNFGAGPAKLPEEVIGKMAEHLLGIWDEWDEADGPRVSVASLGHRSKNFERIIKEAEGRLRTLLQIPETHEVMFLQGGASKQFPMVAQNLLTDPEDGKMRGTVIIVNTGAWSEKALAEHREMKKVHPLDVREVKSLEEITDINGVDYVYLCHNETIDGKQIEIFGTSGVQLVLDISSDIASQQMDPEQWKNIAIAFAGAQKNLGPAGVTVVIVRKDCIQKELAGVPLIDRYATLLGSLYNTPPVIIIDAVNEMLKWIEKEGGMEALEQRSITKASLFYNFLDRSSLFEAHVPLENDEQAPSGSLVHGVLGLRSGMNVTFRVRREGRTEAEAKALEKKLVEEGKALGIIGLPGHRSVGGLRASLYNAIELEDVQALIAFLEEFEEKNAPQES